MNYTPTKEPEMSDTIVLDTPNQINAWVLLSRRGQLKLQQKGLKTPGLIKWCRENIPGCERARVARDCIVPVEYALSQIGADVDYSVVNCHVMVQSMSGIFHDRGVFANPDDAKTPELLAAFKNGNLEMVLTLDDVREPNGQIYVPE